MQCRNRVLGFTLIEILVVISILGILAGIGVVDARQVRRRSYDVVALSDYRNIKRSIAALYSEGGRITVAVTGATGPQSLPQPLSELSLSPKVVLQRLLVDIRNGNNPRRRVVIRLQHQDGTRRFQYNENNQVITETVAQIN